MSDAPVADGGQTAITVEQARAVAQQYATEHLPGFTVVKVEPLAGMPMTMYAVDLQGPANEVRVLRINPWGHVVPDGGSSPRS